MMRLILLTLTALVAFAANSVLNRAALVGEGTDPAAFMGLRLISGAVMLVLLVTLRGKQGRLLSAGSWQSGAALLAYAVAFSFAYLTLDAGIGALVLFGSVQVTMFGGALIAGQRPGMPRWAGAGMGLAGLAVLFLPGAATPEPESIALMVIAGIAWGVYSLRGQGATEPLTATAGNFLLAAPVAGLIWLVVGSGISMQGAALAVASGAVASGLGYAVWYSVLPALGATMAAIAQLTVPLIALGGGMLFLGERPTMAFWIAAALVLGGVGLAALSGRKPAKA
jgi:drug/metabolite transporter (DMT)-like permease